jgi:small-conductance mechanosensitive channel
MMQEINSILNNWKYDFLELLPKILISLLVLVIGYLVAWTLKFFITRTVNYIERLVNRRFQTLNFKQAGTFLGIAFFWLIMFSSVLLVTDILGLTIITNWFQSIIQYIPNVLAAILIILASIILGNIISDFVVSISDSAGLDYGNTLSKIVKFGLIFMAAIIALDQIGIEIALLINIIAIILAAVLFGAALAFGLGAKTSISNILAAFYVRKAYKEGDEIQIGKVKGVIIKIEATNVVLSNELGQVNIPTKHFSETKSYLIAKD